MLDAPSPAFHGWSDRKLFDRLSHTLNYALVELRTGGTRRQVQRQVTLARTYSDELRTRGEQLHLFPLALGRGQTGHQVLGQ